MVDPRASLQEIQAWCKCHSTLDDFGILVKYFHAIKFDTKPIDSPKHFPMITKELLLLQSQDLVEFLIEEFRRIFVTSKNAKSGQVPMDLFCGIIFQEYLDYSFLTLVHILGSERNYKVQLKIIDFLEYFLQNQCLTNLLWKQCLEQPASYINQKPMFSLTYETHCGSLVKALVSLPSIVSNKLKLKTSSIFLPDSYFKLLSNSISDVLQKIHLSVQEGKDCSLHFVSQLFSKLCSTGNADTFFEVLLIKMSSWVKESPLWCRICSKLFTSVPDISLEPCIEKLVKTIDTENIDLLNSLLGDEIMARPKLKFLMTNKFFFVKVFPDDITPYCILRYLSAKPARETCFKEVLYKLLDVWGDRSSIKHISYNQHMYISKCLLLALHCIDKDQQQAWKSELMIKLMEGVPAHLESADEKIRNIGMIVAEGLTRIVDKNGKQLNFDLARSDELEYLYQLSVEPLSLLRSKQKLKEQKITNTKKKIEENTNLENLNDQKGSDCESELDSDDDLEPLNIEEDENESTSVNGVKPPVYLRDCIAGLISSNDPNRLEACLQVLENLVLQQPGDLQDVAVEIAKILLHLDNQYNIDNFYTLKMNSLVTVTTKCPKQVSEYLAEQFYVDNYTINQRLDILEIIAKSASLLSKPDSDNADQHRSHLPLPNIPGLTLNEQKPDWQKIVDERVKNKTRRFVKGTAKPLNAHQNKFSEVAGSFFFPLTKNFGMKLNTCDMMGDDSLILGKFIYTLAVILHSAEGLPVASVMGKSLLDLIWSIRFHKESFVRQSLLYAMSMIVLHVSPYILLTELQVELFEARDWLNGLVQHDPNAECQKLASSCLVLMEKMMKQELSEGS